jgi:protein tyrosine/serine phosphatase
MPASELAAAVDTVIDVREVYLDAALGAAVAEYGSINRYLEVAAGLDAGRRDLLREALLE